MGGLWVIEEQVLEEEDSSLFHCFSSTFETRGEQFYPTIHFYHDVLSYHGPKSNGAINHGLNLQN